MAGAGGREEAPRTELEEARRLFDAGAALFVDVRRPEEHAESHVPGAISLPIAGSTAQDYLRLPRDRQLILY